MIFQNMTVFIK